MNHYHSIFSREKIGILAHVMLPVSAPFHTKNNETRYASNAIEELLNQLSLDDIQMKELVYCLIGGANLLKRKNDSIGKSNAESVEKLLVDKGLEIYSRSIGGFRRRTVLFDIEKG